MTDRLEVIDHELLMCMTQLQTLIRYDLGARLDNPGRDLISLLRKGHIPFEKIQQWIHWGVLRFLANPRHMHIRTRPFQNE